MSGRVASSSLQLQTMETTKPNNGVTTKTTLLEFVRSHLPANFSKLNRVNRRNALAILEKDFVLHMAAIVTSQTPMTFAKEMKRICFRTPALEYLCFAFPEMAFGKIRDDRGLYYLEVHPSTGLSENGDKSQMPKRWKVKNDSGVLVEIPNMYGNNLDDIKYISIKDFLLASNPELDNSTLGATFVFAVFAGIVLNIFPMIEGYFDWQGETECKMVQKKLDEANSDASRAFWGPYFVSQTTEIAAVLPEISYYEWFCRKNRTRALEPAVQDDHVDINQAGYRNSLAEMFDIGKRYLKPSLTIYDVLERRGCSEQAWERMNGWPGTLDVSDTDVIVADDLYTAAAGFNVNIGMCPTCKKYGHGEEACWFGHPELAPWRNVDGDGVGSGSISLVNHRPEITFADGDGFSSEASEALQSHSSPPQRRSNHRQRHVRPVNKSGTTASQFTEEQLESEGQLLGRVEISFTTQTGQRKMVLYLSKPAFALLDDSFDELVVALGRRTERSGNSESTDDEMKDILREFMVALGQRC